MMPIYWADFHKHVEAADTLETQLADAAANIDCWPVLLYPYRFEPLGSIAQETQTPGDQAPALWAAILDAAGRWNRPGKFLAVPAFEWHGCRPKYGDLNVFYFHDHPEKLVYPTDIKDLYAHLWEMRGFAIPHHTAYAVGGGGTDWSTIDDSLVPVTDLFSNHGSSEGELFGCLTHNGPMGPDVTGGGAIDALKRGLKLGLTASNDYFGLPGSHGAGLTAILADQLDRTSLYNAMMARQCYGVTGDRIQLHFSANDHPMGSTIKTDGTPLTFQAKVTGSHAIDRVELVRDGVIVRTHTHNGRWETTSLPERFRVKCRLRFGWGPCNFYGFANGHLDWQANVKVNGGDLLGVEPCFNRLGNRIDRVDGQTCDWHMTTAWQSGHQDNRESIQGLVLEIEGGKDTSIQLAANDQALTYRVGDLLERSMLTAMTDAAKKFIEQHSDVTVDQVDNVDVWWHNAAKIKAEVAVPHIGYEAQVNFTDVPTRDQPHFYYLRVIQRNGQMAWSSPIWTER